jgi:phage-related protein
VLAPIGAAIASVWGVIAPALAAIASGVAAAIAAVVGFVAALPIGTILLVVAAVAALGLGIWQTVKHWASIKAFFASLWTSIVSVVSSGASAVVKFFADAMSGIGTALSQAWTVIVGFFSNLPRNIGFAVGATVAVIMWLPTGIRLAAVSIWQSIVAIGQWFATLPGQAWAMAKSIGAAFVALGSVVGEWFAALPSVVGAAVSQAASWFAGLASALWNEIKAWPGMAWRAAGEFVRGIGTWFASLPGRIKAWFVGVWQYLSALPGEAYRSGVAIVQGIIDGMKSKWADLTAGFREGLQKVSDMLPHSEPKAGPLRGLKNSGKSALDQFGKGVADGAGALQSTWSSALGGMLNSKGGGGAELTLNKTGGQAAAYARGAAQQSYVSGPAGAGSYSRSAQNIRQTVSINVSGVTGNAQEIARAIRLEFRRVADDTRFARPAQAGA